MRREKWWRLPLLLILAAALGITLLVVEIQDRRSKAHLEALREEAASLERQRDELIALRDRRDRETREAAGTTATEQLLFLEPDERIYTQMAPLLRAEGYVGTIGLSAALLPGEPGAIERAHLDELLAEGWELCLICDTPERFKEWDEQISRRLEELELEKPCAVYFHDGRFRRELKDAIAQRGYTVAIHHGEDGDPLVAGDAGGELWLPGAHPWNFSGVRTQIVSNIDKGGDQVFTVSFTDERSIYVDYSFDNMLAYLREQRKSAELLVIGPERARALHDPAQNGVAALQEDWAQERAELEAQICALETQIQQIYEKWDDRR